MNRVLFSSIFILLFLPNAASAAVKVAPLEVSGWLPYWRVATSTTDVLPHLSSLTSVMPFGYIVQNDGSLYDAFGLNGASATSTVGIFVAAAHAEKVKVVPTVMWSNGAATHAILSNATSRQKLEDDIVAIAKANNFDGIDIDFENKFAKTRPYFSLFLKGLYARMGKKWVYCSIEARTPPASVFDVIPKNLEYANDLVAINNYCDRVNIMTYDQGTIDLRLNTAANSKPYVPIADTKWVEKVINFTAQTISKKKLVIGIATYGYEYDLIPLAQGYRYDINWAFNPRYATDLAAELGLTPSRNSAGEMSFVYQATTTTTANLIAAVGSAGPLQATTTPLRIAWWSDASAVNDKIKLAKKLGVRGIALFKLDGGQDPNIWNLLPKK